MADPETFRQVGLAAHMIPVGVGHDRVVDLPVPKRHDLAQLGEQPLAVIAPIDQQLAPARRLDKDAVSLSYVKKVHVKLAVWLRHGHPPQHPGSDGQGARHPCRLRDQDVTQPSPCRNPALLPDHCSHRPAPQQPEVTPNRLSPVKSENGSVCDSRGAASEPVNLHAGPPKTRAPIHDSRRPP